LDKERVRVPIPARRQPRPVRDHFHQSAFPLVSSRFPPVTAQTTGHGSVQVSRPAPPAATTRLPSPRLLPLVAGTACGEGRPNIMLRTGLITQRRQPNQPEVVL